MNNTKFHPVEQCHDGIINCLSGPVKLLAPATESIIIQDIAAALSKQCRFGGQTHWFYSVAQHSIIVSLMAPPELRRAALLHDAAEAYIGDVTKPVKVILGAAYQWIETEWMNAISRRFDVPLADFAKVKVYDLRALHVEHEVLQKQNKPVWKELCKELGITTDMLMPDEAEDIFMQYYWKYFRLTMGDTNLE